MEAIRKQLVTSLSLDSDHIAILHDLHNIPLRKFFAEMASLRKLFTLGQMGFYLFQWCKAHPTNDRRPPLK